MAHSENNKGRRNELRRLNYLRRVRNRRPAYRWPGSLEPPAVYVCYMTTGSPCSCSLCKPHRFTGELKHSERRRIASAEDDAS